ncbi:hypothetical protein ABEB36_003545 [Hypothenemus hampei]|uniref:PEHE domain-containing protein n=1 Tax=Hypothenemus hampei TaxID=57062 RepID=A0ABD1FD53_HYPHA
MRLLSINNDQNIGRVLPKMNDDCQYESNNAKLIDRQDSLTHLDRIDQNSANSYNLIHNENSVLNKRPHNYLDQFEVTHSSNDNCHSAESEVNSLKDWLILHNDLIQQQNDEILKKERQIFILQKENEMLKERLLYLEKGVPYPTKHLTKNSETNIAEDNLAEDMTQDSCEQFEEDSKENINIINTHPVDDAVTSSLEVTNYQSNHANEIESQIDTTIDEDSFAADEFKSEDLLGNDLSDSFKTESDPADCAKDSLSEYNFTVNNFCEFDPMKNIKMSIRRKRISTSSALSNNELPVLGEKKTLRRLKKKRKRSGKYCPILTTKDQYFIRHPSDELDDHEMQNLCGSNLEVPSWRIKVYTSCYTMEGTENLDDEVYNKRHMRLEIDERRRKRWDVQRIREQRVIEKLKQRQERPANGSKGENSQDLVQSLWPKLEDIKYLEIIDELPVSAFGHPIVKLEESDFCLPWLNNPSVLTRTSNSKRTTSRGRKRSRNVR